MTSYLWGTIITDTCFKQAQNKDVFILKNYTLRDVSRNLEMKPNIYGRSLFGITENQRFCMHILPGYFWKLNEKTIV